jgi:hypothetical protein
MGHGLWRFLKRPQAEGVEKLLMNHFFLKSNLAAGPRSAEQRLSSHPFRELESFMGFPCPCF